MSLNRSEVLKLAEVIRLTAEKEIDCSEFLNRMAAYVDKTMAGLNGKQEVVLQHLRVCPECAEEVEVLIRALSDQSGEQPS